MDEITQRRLLKTVEPRRLPHLPWKDIVVIMITIAVIVGIVIFAVSRLALRKETASAKLVASEVVSALSKQDVATLRSLGDKTFQEQNSTKSLNAELTFRTTPSITFSEMYGKTKPIIVQQIVTNNSRGQHVMIIYRYDKLKIPFYIRIDTIKPPHSTHWYMQALGANVSESTLLGG